MKIVLLYNLNLEQEINMGSCIPWLCFEGEGEEVLELLELLLVCS